MTVAVGAWVRWQDLRLWRVQAIDGAWAWLIDGDGFERWAPVRALDVIMEPQPWEDMPDRGSDD